MFFHINAVAIIHPHGLLLYIKEQDPFPCRVTPYPVDEACALMWAGNTEYGRI